MKQNKKKLIYFYFSILMLSIIISAILCIINYCPIVWFYNPKIVDACYVLLFCTAITCISIISTIYLFLKIAPKSDENTYEKQKESNNFTSENRYNLENKTLLNFYKDTEFSNTNLNNKEKNDLIKKTQETTHNTITSFDTEVLNNPQIIKT